MLQYDGRTALAGASNGSVIHCLIKWGGAGTAWAHANVLITVNHKLLQKSCPLLILAGAAPKNQGKGTVA